MSKTVTLLRPFVFSRPATGRGGLATEQKFRPQWDDHVKQWIPTEVDLPDDMCDHPFIAEDYADGCIERPAATEARLGAVKAKKDSDDELGRRELKKAEDALRRASGSHEVQQRASVSQAEQLNTPVNQLQAQHGAGISKTVDVDDLEDALNTPVNKLQVEGPPPPKSAAVKK